VRLWDIGTDKEQASLRGHTGEVNSVSFSPDGKTLAVGSYGRTVKLCEAVTAVAGGWSILTVGRSRGTVKLWEVATGGAQVIRHKGSKWEHADSEVMVRSVAFSPDGKTLAWAEANTVHLWSLETKKERAVLQWPGARVHAVAFSPDSKTLAVGGGSTIMLWDTTTGQKRDTPWMHEPGGFCWQVVFSPNGTSVAAAFNTGGVTLWDAVTGHQRDSFFGMSGQALSVAFSPDGKTLAVGSSGDERKGVPGEIKLWDVATRRQQATLRGHRSAIWCVAFRPDGKTVVSGGADGTVRLWEPVTGQEQLTLRGHDGEVSAVAFSPDGGLLASGSADGTVKLWGEKVGDRKGKGMPQE
jgi:WD40 repeat protein